MQIFDIDQEGVREVLRDLCDCLDDIGFNVPKERFEDENSPMQTFLRTMGKMRPEVAWKQLDDSIKGLEQGVEGNQLALKYLHIAKQDLLKCCTFED